MIREVSTRDRAEQRVRGLLESAPDAIVVVDGVGGIVVVNARAEALFGYTRDQLIGRSVELLVPEAKRNAHAASRHAYGANPRPRHGSRPGDFTARRKDGSVFAVEITLNRIETDDGLLVSSAIRDVTDRRGAERATARLATIVASSPNAIIGVCPDGTIESWNAAAERLYGYPASEAIGQPITIVNAPERADSRDHLDTALRGETVAFESEDLRRDGSRVETAVTISPIRDGGGAITGVACLAQDITERNRAERARARLAAIVESSEDAIMGLTIDGEITSWNRGAELIYGYRESETIGKHVSMLAPAAYEDETAALLGRVGAGERVSHSETIRLRKDGRLIDVSLTISPIRDTAGLVVGASTVARDMTERRAAEDALKRAEERFRRAFDEAPIGMALISIDGALEKVNGALVAICGYARSELEGMELCQVLHPADLDTGIAALRELATGETDGLALDLRIIPAVGSAVDVTVHGTRLGNRSNGEQRLLCQVLDVTDRKRYEQRLSSWPITIR